MHCIYLILVNFFLFILLTTQVLADVKLTQSNVVVLLDCSYDGRKLLFATTKDNNEINLATILIDGTHEKQLTTEEGVEVGWFLPDDSICYWQKCSTQTSLCKIDSDGSNKIILFTFPLCEIGEYTYSQVTKKIAYICKNLSTGGTAIRLVDLNGIQFHGLPCSANEIEFSPDGQWLLFIQKEQTDESNLYATDTIYKVKVDDKGIDNTTLHSISAKLKMYGIKLVSHLSWSPDGTKIAFNGYTSTLGNSIYTIDPEGTNLRNLLVNGEDSNKRWRIDIGSPPKWSPDGKKILWKEDGNLYVMDSDGMAKREIVSHFRVKAIGDYYQWNKQGNRIFFSNGQNIYMVAPDGTGLTKITNNTKPICCVPSELFSNFSNSFSWSGDAKKIAFIRRFNEPFKYRLTIMNKDGTNKYDLVRVNLEKKRIVWVSFKPHKTKILFEIFEIGEGDTEEDMYRYRIYSIASDGTGKTYLDDGICPMWSHDAKQIAYKKKIGNDYFLYIMNSDGTNKRNISPCREPYFFHYTEPSDFAWSYDNQKIVYLYNDDIYVVSISSFIIPVQVTNDGEGNKELCPVFSLDGTKIAYILDKDKASGELWIVNVDGTNSTKLAEEVDSRSKIEWAYNNRIYYVKKDGYIYSIRPDGGDERKESNLSSFTVGEVISNAVFDVSYLGEIIYGVGYNIFYASGSKSEKRGK